MNSSEWSQFLSSRGFHMIDNQGFGVMDRYPVSLVLYGKTAITSIAARIQLAAALKKNYRKEVRQLLKHKAIINYVGTTLTMTIQTGHMQYPYEFTQTMVALINYLRKNNIQESVRCPICGQFETDGLAFYAGNFQRLHLACLDQKLSHQQDTIQKNETRGSFITGISGAILGGICGILPNIITIMYFEHIYVILFALIPICIYYGYKVCRGRMNNAAVIITLVLSVFFLVFMNYLLLVFSVHKTYGLWLFSNCLHLFLDPEYLKELLSGSWTQILFLGLGMLYSWRMITENNTKATTSIEFTRKTIHTADDPALVYKPFKNEE